MNENEKKIAADGKNKKAKEPLTKSELKNMSKYRAQQILGEKNPEVLQKIEAEVAAQAASIKRKIMFVSIILIAIAVYYIFKIRVS